MPVAYKQARASGIRGQEKKVKRDLYKEVTDQIVAALEQGTAPWTKPWNSGLGLPENATTGRAYRGINVLLLGISAAANKYPTDQWLTFKQALAAGVPVRKGEKATRIYFFKPLELKAKDEDRDDHNVTSDPRVIPLLREYYVFNVAQLSGPLPNAKAVEVREFAGDELLDEFLGATGAQISHGGDVACYIPSADAIRLPVREAFKSAPDYYATAVHELTHWTGHETRCKRDLSGAFGSSKYAFEELVAEMGSAFLCAEFGITARLQHASYIANWIKVLQNDKRAVFRASSSAQKAADFTRNLVAAAAGEEKAA